MKKIFGYTAIATVLLLSTAFIAFPAAIQSIAGLAVAQSTTKWNNVKDMAFGDAITSGVMMVSPCLWNGTSCDRQRGTITGGALVTISPSGTAFYSIVRDNITTASVNLAFSFTSKKVAIQASVNNTDEVCIDWLGGTAICPAANTAGDARLIPGQSMILDDYAVTSIAVIAASGTQRVNITAWQ